MNRPLMTGTFAPPRTSLMSVADLDEISLAQARIDLDIANARIVELTVSISSASSELARLRSELEQCKAAEAAVSSALEKKDNAKGALAPLLRSAGKNPALNFPKWLRRTRPGELIWNVDEVCGRVVSVSKPGTKLVLVRSEHRCLEITGWVVPRNFEGPLTSVEIRVGGVGSGLVARAAPMMREDVASHFSDAAAGRSGFRAQFLMADVPSGSYVISLMGNNAAGVSATADVIELTIR